MSTDTEPVAQTVTEPEPQSESSSSSYSKIVKDHVDSTHKVRFALHTIIFLSCFSFTNDDLCASVWF